MESLTTFYHIEFTFPHMTVILLHLKTVTFYE